MSASIMPVVHVTCATANDFFFKCQANFPFFLNLKEFKVVRAGKLASFHNPKLQPHSLT